jgi:hypothetical protein
MPAIRCSAQSGERDVKNPTWEVSRGLRLPISSALESLNMLARSFGRMGLLLALGSRLPACMHITITLSGTYADAMPMLVAPFDITPWVPFRNRIRYELLCVNSGHVQYWRLQPLVTPCRTSSPVCSTSVKLDHLYKLEHCTLRRLALLLVTVI